MNIIYFRSKVFQSLQMHFKVQSGGRIGRKPIGFRIEHIFSTKTISNNFCETKPVYYIV